MAWWRGTFRLRPALRRALHNIVVCAKVMLPWAGVKATRLSLRSMGEVTLDVCSRDIEPVSWEVIASACAEAIAGDFVWSKLTRRRGVST
jgi:hypothetical protein